MLSLRKSINFHFHFFTSILPDSHKFGRIAALKIREMANNSCTSIPVDLAKWTPRSNPSHVPMDGQYVRLEPLDPEAHGNGLYLVSTVPDFQQRFRYLPYDPPTNREQFEEWLKLAFTGVGAAGEAGRMYFVVIDKETGMQI
jgi:hypothetical protein